MEQIKRFEDLEVWKLARELTRQIYILTKKDLFRKDFRFVSQITAASGSIMDNIAEGFERNGNKEFLQFLFIAKGSCGEVQSQLYRALDCEYIDNCEFEHCIGLAKSESVKLLNFINYLQRSQLKGTKYQ